MRRFIPLLAVVFIGCGINPGRTPDAIELTGKVTLNSKPVNGLTLNLQPTAGGTQAMLPVKDGAVKGSVTPGKYTYYLSEGSSTAAFKAVPEKYRSGSLERQIEITGSSTDFVFD